MNVKRLRQIIAELRTIQQEADLWHPDDKADRHLNPELNKHKPTPGSKPLAKPCPPGHVRNSQTGGCMPLRGAKRS
jgi:hypothetical protein